MKRQFFIVIVIILFGILIPHNYVFATNQKPYEIGIHYPYSALNNIDDDLIKIKEAGFSEIRFSFVWKVIEPLKESFDFTYYDKLVTKAKELGLKIVGILGMGTTDMLPDWLINGVDDPNYINYLAQYADSVTKRYSKQVDIWQIENELNHVDFYKWVGWRKGEWSTDKIHKILSTLSSIARENTQSKIMINVIVDNPNWKDFLNSIKDIDYDIIGIDYYPNYLDDYFPNAGDPKKGLEIYNYIQEVRNWNKEIVVAETGYSTYNSIHTYENQADFIKDVLVGALFGGSKNVIFYQYKDYAKGNDIESNFGLIAFDGSLKPAWKIIKNLSEEYASLAINAYLEDNPFNATVFINGIRIQTPINITIPKLNYNMTFEDNLNKSNYIIKIEKIKINENNYNNLTAIIFLENDTKIDLEYSIFYKIFFKVKINNEEIQFPNLKVVINSIQYNIINGTAYLKKGYYSIIIPNYLKIFDRKIMIINNTKNIYIDSNQNITFQAKEIFTLNIIVFDWFGNLKNAIINVNEKEYNGSNITLELPQGNYTVKVFSLYSQKENIYLNKDTVLVFFVPNEIVLVPLALFLIIPFILIARKRKEIGISKIKTILDSALAFFFYIILPYYAVWFLSIIFLQKNIVFYQFNDLLLFGLPIVIVKSLRLIKKFSLIFEALSSFLVTLFIFFIIGRAIYGEFGLYYISYMGNTVAIDVAPYIFLIAIANTLRSLLNFLNLYYK
jgi:hypothetical protein